MVLDFGKLSDSKTGGHRRKQVKFLRNSIEGKIRRKYVLYSVIYISPYYFRPFSPCCQWAILRLQFHMSQITFILEQLCLCDFKTG